MMSLAEIIFVVLLVIGVYFALKPVQKRLEHWLLRLMGRSPGRKGQGNVYVMKDKEDK